MKSVQSIEINLDYIQEGLSLWLDARNPNSLFDAEGTSYRYHEARFQLMEGCFYDYQFSNEEFILGDVGENIVQQHQRTTNVGTIAPNIYVGKLSIPVIEKTISRECGIVEFEVQSVKTGYRDDYRDMLEFITEKSTDLLLRAESPVSQRLQIDYTKDSQTLYQRFAFIKSIIGGDEFTESIHRIVTSPVTRWTEKTEQKDIRNARRLSNNNVREILRGRNRRRLPVSHNLRRIGVNSLPDRISGIRKTDSVDTPENRFVKHALEVFLKFSTDIHNKSKYFGHSKMEIESYSMIRELESQLHHSLFKDVSRPTTLKLNSPVLQRKEGYREVLRVWLMFDLAAKLIWSGGNDIYSAGKKDVATLYEYWLFFKLLSLLQSIFDIKPKGIFELFKETPDGLNLQLKQGQCTALLGIHDSGSRKLNIRFSYNRSFNGNNSYPDSGSWTTTLRPDFTLSIWPRGISEQEAETLELIVHVHFDAKYKIANLTELLEMNLTSNFDEEKTDNRKGIYKNADLLKMHAYKDAIRRTGGAYVLYPGDKVINQKGFHEIIPGLGAFPVRPSKIDSGIGELKAFILEVVKHFINRTTQREKIAYSTYDIFKNPPNSDDILNEPLPELFDINRGLIPDNTYILVGFYKSSEQYSWITKKKLYNFRMGSGAGSLILDKETVSSKYLLLHSSGDTDSGDLWKIVGQGPKVYSKQDLLNKEYPSPTQEFYLVIEIETVSEPEFEKVKWNFRKLKNYTSRRLSAYPFTTNLTELMKNIVN